MNTGPAVFSPAVSTQWLADFLGADGLVVVDASVQRMSDDPTAGFTSGRESYLLDGHIPGAVFADLIAQFSDPDGPYPFTRPGPARFAAAVGALGIGNNSTVVVYDSDGGQWASRLWWLFRGFGHDRVAVLDGGLTEWNRDSRPLETGTTRPGRARFTAAERPELWVDKAYVEAVVRGEVDAALVCTAPAEEFAGTASPRPRAGHIPGSVSVPARSLLDRGSTAFGTRDYLSKALAPALGASPVVLYCGGGVDATAAALGLTLLGKKAIAVYDGSLAEWADDPAAELVSS